MPSIEIRNVTGYKPAFIHHPEFEIGGQPARNVASGTPKTFSLIVAPGEYYLMFITNEGTPSQRSFTFQNVTGGNDSH